MEESSNCPKRTIDNDSTYTATEPKKRKLDESHILSECKRTNLNHCLETTENNDVTTLCEEILNETDASQNHLKDEFEETISTDVSNVKNRVKESESYLLSLSDDVLLILLSYLNSTDLYYLSCCNRRLFNICGDKTLWNWVSSTCDGTNPVHQSLAVFFHSSTNYLRFLKDQSRINQKVDTCFDTDFFERIVTYAPNLQTLIVENHTFKESTFTLKYLPSSLTELRLINLELVDPKNRLHFGNINDTLPNLEILDVSFCQWFDAHSLLALAKCSNLRELRITGCRNLQDFIPYASIAATFGFKQLQTLDMRLTDMVDREIACFNKTKTLKHIYLERPEDHNEVGDESVTDVCTTSFGMRPFQNPHSQVMVFITRVPAEGCSITDHTLETLVIRNYPGITDITLKHAQNCLKSLKYLDVTGCSCTAAQASIFKVNRPEVKLIFDGSPL